MATSKVSQVSFAGGEISTDMYGRQDDVKYQNGLKKCRNFVALPQGPVRTRPGFTCVNETKYSGTKSRLIPFVFNSEQTCVIELGHLYARFYSDGAVIMNGDVPYEISTPWSASDLDTLKFVQFADVITVVSKKYAPKRLCRYGWTDWRVQSLSFDPILSAPTGVTATRATAAASDSNADKYTFKYRVSAMNDDKTRESEPSGVVACVANLYATGTTIKISWNAVSGARYYRVYKNQGGLYCYLGDTEDLSIIDDNIAPKADITVKRYDQTFSQAGGKPGAVGYFEQRLCLGGFNNDPQRIIMTRSGTDDDTTYSLPNQNDDRISFQIATREFNGIEHFIPLAHLLVLTSGGELRISPQNSDAITPSSVSARPQSYNGASPVQPVLTNNSAVYCAARGGHVFDITYKYDAGGYNSNDITLRATHFFDFKTIVDMTISKSPYPIVFCVSSDGSLLGCTYIPGQNLEAWYKIETKGEFESVTCVSEGVEDHLYAVIKRKINGVTKRFVERMEAFKFDSISDAYFVDCGGTYDGRDTSTKVSRVRIPWLIGETVSILADGAVMPQQVVGSDGYVNVGREATVVTVGLPYDCDVQTLPLIMQVPGYGNGHYKNISRINLKVYRSSGVFAGPTFDTLVEHKQRTTEQPGSPPDLFTGDIRLQLLPQWQTGGEVCIRQSDPLPLHILNATVDVAI